MRLSKIQFTGSLLRERQAKWSIATARISVSLTCDVFQALFVFFPGILWVFQVTLFEFQRAGGAAGWKRWGADSPDMILLLRYYKRYSGSFRENLTPHFKGAASPMHELTSTASFHLSPSLVESGTLPSSVSGFLSSRDFPCFKKGVSGRLWY